MISGQPILPWTKAELDAFSRTFDGHCLTSETARYESACRLYNAMIQNRPDLILQCTSEQDVAKAVKFAQSLVPSVHIKGGGHNLSGLALGHRGITIDVSQLRAVQVNHVAQTVLVQGGCRLSDVDSATSKFHMAVPLGTVSDTGVGGLALGGGLGWLLPRYGLTCDNIEEVRLINADGNLVIANAKTNSDLFWALRGGGGGNYGIVLDFKFSMFPVFNVTAGSAIYELKDLQLVASRLCEINQA